jgi:ABC-type lipoprotein release transport system permease subunit
MIILGVVDIILLVILIALIYVSARRRRSLAIFVAMGVIALIMIERVVPGTLASVGSGIRSLDAINNSMPHLQIEPIIKIAR